MTKLRAPLTFAQAVTRVAGQIGWSACSAITGRSVRTVRLWSEPDQEVSPTLEQALALDVAYAAAGGEGYPIHEAYALRLETQVTDMLACRTALITSVQEAMTEVHEGLAASLDLASPGATPAKAYRAIAEMQDGIGKMTALIRRVRAFVLPGAVPCTGNDGGAQ